MTRLACCSYGVVLFILIVSLLYSITSAAAETPKRIISLAPNVTEILFALGLNDNVVGVTSFCDYPEEARDKPKVGGMSNPSLERVVSLIPDMVIMTTDGNPKVFAEKLQSFRIQTYVFRARTLSELPQGIRDLGSALGVREKAGVLARDIESSMNNLSQFPHQTSRKEKVLFIIWPEPLIVAGPGTAIDDAITTLGHYNIAAKSQSSYPKYSIEETILREPDVIFIGKGHADMQEMSKGLLKKLSKVPAVKNHRVFFVSDNLYRLGPRVVHGIEEMAACLK
ncbi:MAG: periplasmic binding protein [Nitrospirae bacterium]|nr:periplasmic binding protein [Nitrospirota bacterium]